MLNKVLIITGPTATGKTELAIKLAKKFNGELVNADSRQVYQGMDIGTGKDMPVNSKFQIPNSKLNSQNLTIGYREKEGIPIWLVDVCKPNYTFNVGEYQKIARLVIGNIQNRGRIPIIVGGTGLYIRSIIEPLSKMSIPPNPKLRQQLNNLTVSQLQKKLVHLSKKRLERMNNSDINNPRRLVRAIEIEEYYLSLRIPAISNNSPLLTGDYLLIGLKISEKLLAQKINDRVEKRYKQGILEEIQKLLISGFNFDYPSMSGLGYSEWKNYFISSKFKVHSSKKIEIINKIKELWKLHERQYVKKQMTFLKKIPNINWFDASKPKFYSLIETKVGSWYNKNT